MPPGGEDRHRPSVAEVLWILAPFGVFLLVLQRLWSNAPIMDDYDTVFGMLVQAEQLRTAGEWVSMVFQQHNEHRIAVTRLIVLALARSTGEIDFRVLMLIGNLSLLGTFLFIWREFRNDVAAPLIGAAAIVTFQWSYYETSLMGSASLPHFGVVFFAFGCLFFVSRGGAAATGLAMVFGALAAASQANGLFALPIAAAGCALQGHKRRAALFAVLATAAWVLYFRHFIRIDHHPSPFLALSNPVAAFHLFCVILGGILPGTKASAILGVVVLACIAWLLRKGLWRSHPAVALWIAFILASAGASAVGRVGWGVVQTSRYALLSTVLLVILGLRVLGMMRPLDRKATGLALLAAATVSVAVSLVIWPQVREYARIGHLLKEALPTAPGVQADRFDGGFHPVLTRAYYYLAEAGRHGYYAPPKELVHPSRIVAESDLPEAQRETGHIDTVTVSGNRVSVTGWSDVTAQVPRTFHVVSSPPFRRAGPVAALARPDATAALRAPEAIFAGFRLELEYESEAEARTAAQSLCIAVEAPGRPRTRLAGPVSRLEACLAP